MAARTLLLNPVRAHNAGRPRRACAARAVLPESVGVPCSRRVAAVAAAVLPFVSVAHRALAAEEAPPALQAAVTSRVYLDVAIGGAPAGRLRVGLFGETVPRTAENVRQSMLPCSSVLTAGASSFCSSRTANRDLVLRIPYFTES